LPIRGIGAGGRAGQERGGDEKCGNGAKWLSHDDFPGNPRSGGCG
jgi:hypothetical protein